VAQSVSAIDLCDHGEWGVDEFVGGGAPFVGAQQTTQFQAGGTVRAGEKDGRATTSRAGSSP